MQIKYGSRIVNSTWSLVPRYHINEIMWVGATKLSLLPLSGPRRPHAHAHPPARPAAARPEIYGENMKSVAHREGNYSNSFRS